jgi:beta-galactosidase
MKFWHGADYNYEQWLDSPEVHDQDFEGMVRTKSNVMAIGIFSWAKYEPREGDFHFEWMDRLMDRLAANGMKAVLATPSGAKPAWLSKAYPEVCRTDVHGRREPHGYRHNHCRSSQVYRAKVTDLNTRLALRYKDHPALALWHVSNEYNGGRCYCEGCLDAFRAWLRTKYGSLEALNKAWWSTFWSHTIGDWSEIFPADTSMNAMMLDWNRFVSDHTIDFYLHETQPLRQITPTVPVTTNFQMPDVGLDYFAFAQHVDVVSWDNYPRWHFDGNDPAVAAKTGFFHDLFRSTKGKPFLLMESTPSNTNWQGVSPLKRPGMHLLASVQAVAHGSDSVQYFQWRQSRGGEEKFHGAVLDHRSAFETRTFGDVGEVGAWLEAHDHLWGTGVTSEAAVVFDFANGWALDLAQLPRSLEKRYYEECQGTHAALGRRGIAADVVDVSPRDWSQYKLVVVPMLYSLEASTARAFEAYVAGGGTLVVTYLTGLVDGTDLCHRGGAPGPLANLLGLQVSETDALADHVSQTLTYAGRSWPVRHYADLLEVAPGTEVVGTYGAEFYAGTPALTRRPSGKGAAWYLAARPGADFWNTFLAERCTEAGIRPVVDWTIPPGVSVRRRGNAVFVMNFNGEEVVVGDHPPRTLAAYGLFVES